MHKIWLLSRLRGATSSSSSSSSAAAAAAAASSSSKTRLIDSQDYATAILSDYTTSILSHVASLLGTMANIVAAFAVPLPRHFSIPESPETCLQLIQNILKTLTATFWGLAWQGCPHKNGFILQNRDLGIKNRESKIISDTLQLGASCMSVVAVPSYRLWHERITARGMLQVSLWWQNQAAKPFTFDAKVSQAPASMSRSVAPRKN